MGRQGGDPRPQGGRPAPAGEDRRGGLWRRSAAAVGAVRAGLEAAAGGTRGGGSGTCSRAPREWPPAALGPLPGPPLRASPPQARPRPVVRGFRKRGEASAVQASDWDWSPGSPEFGGGRKRTRGRRPATSQIPRGRAVLLCAPAPRTPWAEGQPAGARPATSEAILVSTCGPTRAGGGAHAGVHGRRAEFIQEFGAGAPGREGCETRPPTSESRLPLAPGVFGNPAREPGPAPPAQVSCGRASRPRPSPGPASSVPGRPAGSRPPAASPSHPAQAAAAKTAGSHVERRSSLSPGWARTVSDQGVESPESGAGGSPPR